MSRAGTGSWRNRLWPCLCFRRPAPSASHCLCLRPRVACHTMRLSVALHPKGLTPFEAAKAWHLRQAQKLPRHSVREQVRTISGERPVPRGFRGGSAGFRGGFRAQKIGVPWGFRGVPRGFRGVPPGVPRWRVEKAALRLCVFCSIFAHVGGGSASQTSTFAEPPFWLSSLLLKLKKEKWRVAPAPGANIVVAF